MVRLSDMPPEDAAHLREKSEPAFDTTPWADGPPLARRRVAIVTTAGLHRKDERRFELRDLSYRVIPGEIAAGDLVMSHSSVNFDRSGFQDDINVVFPLDRLKELAEEGVVGSIGRFHYSFMGAGWLPHEIESAARELAGLLKQDRVDAALLVPV